MFWPSRTFVKGRDPALLPHGRMFLASSRGTDGGNMSSIFVKNVPSCVDIDCMIEWIIMRSARRHEVASIARRGGG
jgi:hypothetical protein